MIKRYDEESKTKILKELASSGLSLPEFSRRSGVSDTTLSRWRKEKAVSVEEFMELGAPRLDYEIERKGVILRVPATERLERVV